ncbi:GMC oxidoreductase-like protein [Cercophora newfieldiana]|uniref:GMC oxidoreductase-like protein n=1 Tax=Cercophora newfieldiana TaxID=92897 RepID=A0AA39Y0E9_9PEZI|nr:GMC oxidoreductase-like protein [Cercophora newfieldiana]
MKFQLAALVLANIELAVARQGVNYQVKRKSWELSDDYDFLVVGGGTAGLTVADRLTEAFPGKNTLVVEYGDIEYAPGQFDPPKIIWGEAGGYSSRWELSSTPSPELNNNTAFVIAGKSVGGSSATNGMVFDRGSKYDYDAWQQLQDTTPNQTKSHRWDWEGLYPWFKKSVTFTPSSPEIASQYNYTWESSTYGNTTPIHASFPPFQWGDHFAVRNAWEEAGIELNNECANGNKEGLCWVPISQHPVTARRSHAGLGHYADVVNKGRENYHLVVRHQVTRLVYPSGDPTAGPPLVEIRSVDSGETANITVKAEVVLSAGVFGSTAVLQRSGIGSASFLKNLGIPVVVDLPGVGANLQDHSGPVVTWQYATPPNFTAPMPQDMLNPPFAAAAAAAFNSTPATGPYTLAMSDSFIFISLPNMTTPASLSTLLSKIHSLATANSTTALYLPPVYSSDPTLLAGYRAQLLALADLYASPHAPSLESAFATGTTLPAALLHPLSRGTVRLNGTHPLQPPVLDYRSASNPIDVDLHLVHLRYVRRAMQAKTMRGLGVVGVQPGVGVQSDEEMVKYIRGKTTQSFMHPCCTTAMMPREWGGVVSAELKVHGAAGLRIVDAGVFPILPSAHLSATVYAVAEKAASIIIEDWSGR